ncbi:EamA family transporter [Candidatus Bathyarchaeota archaeon]|nr:EamA family transporter [Candidatus Bathyarchaeota archaeon]
MREAYGYMTIVAASVVWGTMGIFGKLAFNYAISPATLIALRLLTSSLTLVVLTFFFRREHFLVHRRDLPLLLVLGVFGTALQRLTYFYAIELTTVTMAAVLFYTYPIFVTLCASLLFKEKITLTTVLAIVSAFIGVALVVKAYAYSSMSTNVLGIAAGLLSSIFFVAFFFIAKNFRNKYSSWTLILYGDTIGAAMLSPIIASSVSEIAVFPLQLWLLVLVIAWFPSLVGYLLYSHALKHVKSSKGSILSVAEPLSAAMFSVAVFGETFEPLQLLGAALALTGVVLLFYKPKLG